MMPLQPPLRRGSKGPGVELLQQLVGVPVDGDFGPRTLMAVQAFQRAHDLDDDGVVGAATWAALQAVPVRPGVIAPWGVAAHVSVTAEQIAKGFPRCKDPAAWAAAFTAAFARFPEFTRKGAACVLAKANTEAGGLTVWDENLYYTTAAQVRLMFGSRAGSDPASLLRNPVLLGNTVYSALGGYPARGGGVIQLTGRDNQTAFSADMGMTLAQGRDYMRTIPGAAMTAPWYLSHYKAVPAANRGDMRAILAVVAGKTVAGMAGIWKSVHGDRQMADYDRMLAILGG